MGTANILVIDSEMLSLAMISNTLRLEGHAVTTTDNPLTPLFRGKQLRLNFDLVLTTINLRPIGGFEVGRRLKRAGLNIPVVYMLESQAIAEIIAKGLGADSVLRKPFTANQLRRIVTRCLDNGGTI
jgi:CheY-like chemotaxis protein